MKTGRTDIKTDAKAEAKADVKAEAKADATAETQAEIKKERRVLKKREMCRYLAKKHGIPQSKVIEMVQSLLDGIIAALKRGETVEFREFGVFMLTVRKARVGRNPRKPSETIHIPERRNVKFKPGRMMKLVLKKLKVEEKH